VLLLFLLDGFSVNNHPRHPFSKLKSEKIRVVFNKMVSQAHMVNLDSVFVTAAEKLYSCVADVMRTLESLLMTPVCEKRRICM